MKKIEIYWQDLTEKAQRNILEMFGEDEEFMNWDVIPMAIIEMEDEPDTL